jgi:hypothetical protein
MPERRSFKRKTGFRDSCLIIIATEGVQTEKQYFDGLKLLYPNPRVHTEVLSRKDTASDPNRVMRDLDEFRSTYKLRKGHDQLWLVIDVDRWGTRKLSSVCKQCQQKDYQVAVSNPAFEIWLIFHVCSLDFYSPHIQDELHKNNKQGDRNRLETELVSLLGSYNKANPNMDDFGPRVYTAIENARLAEKDSLARWPNKLGTRVHLLVENIIPRGK